MIFFNLIIPNNNIIEYKFSNITLKIQGPGFSNILGASNVFSNVYYPNIIYINGNPNYPITYQYYFNEINNTVNLIWNNSINVCENMFYECSNITEIDLSNSNTSRCTSMSGMFLGCSKLTSLNLSNFNTSNVKNMDSMFKRCPQLKSLDLSSFNISKVETRSAIFDSCSQLKSLNLCNFNTSSVRNMRFMFGDCSQLTSLNLSHFDTSSLARMDSMFSGCSQLQYINLKNFIAKNYLVLIFIIIVYYTNMNIKDYTMNIV